EACHLAPGHRLELAEHLDAVVAAADLEGPRLGEARGPLAVLALEKALVCRARPAVRDAVRERAGIAAQLAAGDVLVGQDLVVAVTADDVLGDVAGDALGAFAPKDDLTIVVDDVDALGDGVDEVGQEAVEGASSPG